MLCVCVFKLKPKKQNEMLSSIYPILEFVYTRIFHFETFFYYLGYTILASSVGLIAVAEWVWEWRRERSKQEFVALISLMVFNGLGLIFASYNIIRMLSAVLYLVSIMVAYISHETKKFEH